MTPAQAAWLRKLRDEGPQPFAWTTPASKCWGQGWTESDKPRDAIESITPAGLAALTEYEENVK